MENPFKDKMTDAEFEQLQIVMESAAKDYLASEQEKTTNILNSISELESASAILYEEQRIAVYPRTSAIMDERNKIRKQIRHLKSNLMNQENILEALKKGGSVIQIEDKTGNITSNIPDFRSIETKNISFDEDKILIEEKPNYIPIINEETFKSKGYVFDAIRVNKDSYILAISGFKTNPEEKTDYVLVTLDQLVLCMDYYFTKAKAAAKKIADDQTERSEKHYDSLPESNRERHLNQKNYYSSLPTAVKKKVTQEQWESFNLVEKESYYKPFKKYGSKRLVSKLREDQMWISFHKMYETFVNPEHKEGSGKVLYDWEEKGYIMKGSAEFTLNKSPKSVFGHPMVFSYWKEFREMMNFKILDIQQQREELSENYAIAMETSFGLSNTNDELLGEYGILVKRQNGDQINALETEQIACGINSVYNIFGNLKTKMAEYGMKISHTGKKNVFASKSIGVFISQMGTIAISDKYSDEEFKSTFSHEVAHFIDYILGETNGKRHASDDYESTAGILGFTLRNHMNKPKTEQTDYINSTSECFARAMEQFFMIEHFGDEAEIVFTTTKLDHPEKIFSNDNFVNKENYYNKIRPLILQLLEENKQLFDSNQLPDIGNMIDKKAEIQDAINGLEILLDLSPIEEKKEIQEAIDGLLLLLEVYNI